MIAHRDPLTAHWLRNKGALSPSGGPNEVMNCLALSATLSALYSRGVDTGEPPQRRRLAISAASASVGRGGTLFDCQGRRLQ